MIFVEILKKCNVDESLFKSENKLFIRTLSVEINDTILVLDAPRIDVHLLILPCYWRKYFVINIIKVPLVFLSIVYLILSGCKFEIKEKEKQ